MGRRKKKNKNSPISFFDTSAGFDRKFNKLFAEYKRLGYPDSVAYDRAMKEALEWTSKERLVDHAEMTIKMLVLTGDIPESLEKTFMSLARWYIRKISAGEVYPVYDVIEEGIRKFKLNRTPYEEPAKFLLESLYKRSRYL